MKGLAYINGNFVPLKDAKISILDRGFRYGEGLFETICIDKGKAIFLKEHFERLKNSAKALDLKLSVNLEQVEQITKKLIKDSSINKGLVNVYLTKTDEEERNTNFIIVVKDEIRYKESDYKKGYTAIISSIRIDSSLSINSHKTLSFLPHILAKKETSQKGADEAILLSTDGFVLEGTTSNIFMIKGDNLITPPVDSGILPGITRAKILQLAPSVGLKPEEKLVHPVRNRSPLGDRTEMPKAIPISNGVNVDFLKSCDEVFLTSSLIEVMPVVKIDNTPINNGKIGRYAVVLRGKYRKMVKEEGR